MDIELLFSKGKVMKICLFLLLPIISVQSFKSPIFISRPNWASKGVKNWDDITLRGFVILTSASWDRSRPMSAR